MTEKNDRRKSSILKPAKPRNPLSDVDLNPNPTEDVTKQYRRVSFASNFAVREFTINPAWHESYEKNDSLTDSFDSKFNLNSDEPCSVDSNPLNCTRMHFDENNDNDLDAELNVKDDINDSVTMDFTEGIANNIIVTKDISTVSTRRQTIYFTESDGDVDITQSIDSNILITNKENICSRNDKDDNLENVQTCSKLKRQTIHFNDNCNEMDVTVCVGNIIKTQNQKSQECLPAELHSNDDNLNITKSGGSKSKRRTIHFNETSNDMDLTTFNPAENDCAEEADEYTQRVQLPFFIPTRQKRQTIHYNQDSEECNMDVTNVQILNKTAQGLDKSDMELTTGINLQSELSDQHPNWLTQEQNPIIKSKLLLGTTEGTRESMQMTVDKENKGAVLRPSYKSNRQKRETIYYNDDMEGCNMEITNVQIVNSENKKIQACLDKSDMELTKGINVQSEQNLEIDPHKQNPIVKLKQFPFSTHEKVSRENVQTIIDKENKGAILRSSIIPKKRQTIHYNDDIEGCNMDLTNVQILNSEHKDIQSLDESGMELTTGINVQPELNLEIDSHKQNPIIKLKQFPFSTHETVSGENVQTTIDKENKGAILRPSIIPKKRQTIHYNDNIEGCNMDLTNVQIVNPEHKNIQSLDESDMELTTGINLPPELSSEINQPPKCLRQGKNIVMNLKQCSVNTNEKVVSGSVLTTIDKENKGVVSRPSIIPKKRQTIHYNDDIEGCNMDLTNVQIVNPEPKNIQSLDESEMELTTGINLQPELNSEISQHLKFLRQEQNLTKSKQFSFTTNEQDAKDVQVAVDKENKGAVLRPSLIPKKQKRQTIHFNEDLEGFNMDLTNVQIVNSEHKNIQGLNESEMELKRGINLQSICHDQYFKNNNVNVTSTVLKRNAKETVVNVQTVDKENNGASFLSKKLKRQTIHYNEDLEGCNMDITNVDIINQDISTNFKQLTKDIQERLDGSEMELTTGINLHSEIISITEQNPINLKSKQVLTNEIEIDEHKILYQQHGTQKLKSNNVDITSTGLKRNEKISTESMQTTADKDNNCAVLRPSFIPKKQRTVEECNMGTNNVQIVNIDIISTEFKNTNEKDELKSLHQRQTILSDQHLKNNDMNVASVVLLRNVDIKGNMQMAVDKENNGIVSDPVLLQKQKRQTIQFDEGLEGCNMDITNVQTGNSDSNIIKKQTQNIEEGLVKSEIELSRQVNLLSSESQYSRQQIYSKSKREFEKNSERCNLDITHTDPPPEEKNLENCGMDVTHLKTSFRIFDEKGKGIEQNMQIEICKVNNEFDLTTASHLKQQTIHVEENLESCNTNLLHGDPSEMLEENQKCQTAISNENINAMHSAAQPSLLKTLRSERHLEKSKNVEETIKGTKEELQRICKDVQNCTPSVTLNNDKNAENCNMDLNVTNRNTPLKILHETNAKQKIRTVICEDDNDCGSSMSFNLPEIQLKRKLLSPEKNSENLDVNTTHLGTSPKIAKRKKNEIQINSAQYISIRKTLHFNQESDMITKVFGNNESVLVTNVSQSDNTNIDRNFLCDNESLLATNISQSETIDKNPLECSLHVVEKPLEEERKEIASTNAVASENKHSTFNNLTYSAEPTSFNVTNCLNTYMDDTEALINYKTLLVPGSEYSKIINENSPSTSLHQTEAPHNFSPNFKNIFQLNYKKQENCLESERSSELVSSYSPKNDVISSIDSPQTDTSSNQQINMSNYSIKDCLDKLFSCKNPFKFERKPVPQYSVPEEVNVDILIENFCQQFINPMKTNKGAIEERKLSLEDKIKQKSEDASWDIISWNNNEFVFTFMNNTIKFVAKIDRITEMVENLDVFSYFCETKSHPVAIYVHNISAKRVTPNHIKSACGQLYNILSLLDYVNMVAEQAIQIMDEFDKLEAEYAVIVDTDLNASFHITNYFLQIAFGVKINLTNLDNVLKEHISLNVLVGNVNVSAIKDLAKECSQGISFLREFINTIYKYFKLIQNSRLDSRKYKR